MNGHDGDAAVLRAFLARTWRQMTLRRVLDGVSAGAIAAFVTMLIARVAAASRFRVAEIAIPVIIAAAFQLRRAWKSRSRVALDVEREVVQFHNVLVTSVELMDAPGRVRPQIASLVLCRAADIAASVDPRMLFPVGRAALRAGAMTLICAVTFFLLSRASGAAASRLAPVTGAAAVRHVDVTVSPPAYSHLPFTVVRDPTEVRAIAGSLLRVHVEAVADSVALDMLEARLVFTRESADAFSADVTVDRDGYLAIEPASTAGTGLRRLIGLAVDPDRAPAVRVLEPRHDLFLSGPDVRRLPITASAEDDIGLTAIRVKYTLVSGSGEDFRFKEGELPVRVARESERRWTASATLDLGAFGLDVGDMVVYRAVASDARPGAPETESDALVVQIVNPDQAPAGGFAADDDPNRFAISERMIMLKTEQLIARKSTVSAEVFAEQAQGIAALQRRVRAEFIFMMGGEMEDAAAVADTLDETAEAAREDELAAGRLQNRGAVDLIFATRHMSRAADALTRPDAPAALTSETAALAALQRAFTKSRYLLRTLSSQERLDMTRRLTGALTGVARDARAPAESSAPPRTAALRRALAGIASLAAPGASLSADAARATALAESVLRVDASAPALRSIAKGLADAAADITAGRRTSAAARIDQAAVELAGVIRSETEDAPRPTDWPAGRLRGAVADALREGVKR